MSADGDGPRDAPPRGSSQGGAGVPGSPAGQDEDMLRRMNQDPEDVDLRDERDGEAESAAVANPRRTRR